MLRRLVSVLALSAVVLASPAFAASKSSKKGSKPAATKSSKSTKTAKKAAPAATPTPVAEAPAPEKEKAPAPVSSGKSTFIKTHRAGWQQVAVGNKVTAFRADGSKVTGTIKEVSDYSIVIEPKKTERVTIASKDLDQVYAAH